MGRQIGPVCKLCRREGVKLFLKGKKCDISEKCAVDKGRPAPGVHGARRSKKMSDYGVQLREKQKLRRQYGLQEKQFRNLFKKAVRKHGVTGTILLQMLEMRLDNVIYRLGFAESRKSARIMVSHGHVMVNGRKVNIPSYIVSVDSEIKVKDKTKSIEKVKNCMEVIQREVPEWIARDEASLSGKILSVPTREQISPIVNEQLIVELYSK